MKKYIYHSLFGLNLIALILAILQMVLFGIGYSQDELQTILKIRFNLTFFILIFIIWNIVIWAKKDKKIGRLLALFFLPGIYTLFYYRIVIKNKYLD